MLQPYFIWFVYFVHFQTETACSIITSINNIYFDNLSRLFPLTLFNLLFVHNNLHQCLPLPECRGEFVQWGNPQKQTAHNKTIQKNIIFRVSIVQLQNNSGLISCFFCCFAVIILPFIKFEARKLILYRSCKKDTHYRVSINSENKN